MPSNPSLFAQKLRTWRTKSGGHGRMTQEQLAELLDVSVDAIGKYERSLSFIRGDLEHRLTERLGWSREKVLACREEWETRRPDPSQGSYRLLDDSVVDDVFEGSWHHAIRAMIQMADTELGRLPEQLEANEAVFLPIYDTYRNHWSAVMLNDQFVAKWSLVLLQPDDVETFRSGKFIETKLSVDRIHRPILPGTYYGYCPVLIVSPGHEAAALLLLSSFIRFLEDLAARGITLHGIGAITCSGSGVQICKDLGMSKLCDYFLGPEYGIWELTGDQVPSSIFGRRSARLHQSYSMASNPPDVVSSQ